MSSDDEPGEECRSDEERVESETDASQPNTDRVKAALGRLAGTDDEAVIRRAEAAIGDLEAAAAFVDSVGLYELESAIERVDDPRLGDRGVRALEAFGRFRAAAAGDFDPDHFHRGRGTALRRDAEGSNR